MPVSPKPTDRQAQTSSPVNGSVRPDPDVAVDWPEVDELLLLLGPLDDSDEPEAEPEDDDELPAEEDEEDPDPWEDEEPEP